MRTCKLAIICALSLLLCSCGDLLTNAKTGNIDRIQKGLDSGASINKRDHNGNTPLIVATLENQFETMEFLCKKGANINAQNLNGATALILAVYYKQYDAVKILLKYNPNKSIKDNHGNTAMDYAEYYYNPKMIDLLK